MTGRETTPQNVPVLVTEMEYGTNQNPKTCFWAVIP